MNTNLIRYLTMVAMLAMSFTLVMPASAQLAINRIDDSARVQQLRDQAGDTVPESPNGIYIIEMNDDPVVAYKGGVKGLKATKPQKGEKIDPNSKRVTDYVGHLNAKHAEALNSVGGGQKVYNYHYSFNGFAAKLSHDQAKQMQSVDGVSAVRADEFLILDTATTPAFIGLDAPGGLWEQLGGVDSSGEDVIIGMVDGGVWPESLSFTDRTGTNGNASKDGKLSYHHMPIWHGECRPGEAFNSSHCNQKLIGARYYNAGFGGDAGIDEQIPHEFNSPRDFGGHGTHTSSTAGGNHNTPLTGDAADLLGTVSGIAPRARIATYKVCWQFPAGGSCATSDSTAAIDQAVADGVDVINYSISGSRTNFLDSVEVAFLFAADAGVFVAASAGNSGPTASTVAHPGPWLTTVAATTHDRNFDADLTLGNDDTYRGASTNTTGAGPADLVYSDDVGLGGADPTEARLCYPGTLDPALVTGKIVLCDRGVIARVDKSLAVFMAGGVGSILANPGAGSLNADFHSVPTVHVDNVSGDAIRAYATGGGTPTAEIFPSFPAPVDAPFIAGFSSRGPLLAGEGDLLKPDIAAPGQDIIAAVAPPGNGGQDFASYGGTSMSSPHVAGLAALLIDLHPDWTPMMIKSALMTSATDLLPGPDPFAQGAGFVNPTGAADPGLVYDHDFGDWLDFLFDGGSAYTDLNGASIAIGALLGSQTTTRTVTSVGSTTETYVFSVSVPGIDVTASPSSFTIAPGATQTVDITLAVDGAPVNTYATGFVTWTGDMGHVVRSPVAVQPAQINADAEIDGVADGSGDGSVEVDVEFGYTGAYTASVSGLLDSMSTGVVNLTGPQGNSDLWCIDFPANAHVRIATFDEDTSDPGADDIDLDVLRGNADCATTAFFVARYGSSGGATSEEVVDISNGPAASYFVFVDFFASSNGTDTNYNLWFQPVFGDEGNTTVTAPAAAVLGDSGTVTVDYTGLVPTRNLGILHHEDGVGEIARTILDIDAR